MSFFAMLIVIGIVGAMIENAAKKSEESEYEKNARVERLLAKLEWKAKRKARLDEPMTPEEERYAVIALSVVIGFGRVMGICCGWTWRGDEATKKAIEMGLWKPDQSD